jgi:hypothetical protein
MKAKSTGPQYNEAARASRWFAEKRRATSAIEYQIRGQGCGVVVLKAIEQHITTEQDHCQQTISKKGRLPGSVNAHFAGSLSLRITAQLFVAVLASSASTPTAHALASE